MDETQGVEYSEPPTMWRCGDPYQHPIPKAGGDSWEVVFEAQMRRDKARCDAWKDEVQNLLIFAGLFSAVVTAFVVESAKSLRTDPAEVSTFLLSTIANSLNILTNATQSSTIPTGLIESFAASAAGPSSSTVRINIFWFMSLVLSLTAVLIGIVSLQWLREHQKYDTSLSPQQAVGIFNMRDEALSQWRVPAIFASLPLLLQAALILFFVGIIDFLQSLSIIVMIPIAALLLCPIMFIVGTTTLPTLQCFTASVRLPSSDSKIPAPCPYKSPQSFAFRRIATSSQNFFVFVHSHIVQLLYLLHGISPSLKSPDKPQRSDAWRYRLLSARAFLFWAHRSWGAFDRTWLILRNEHFDITRRRRAEDPPHQPILTEPIYDAVRSISCTAIGNEYNDVVVFSVYHCFQDLVQLTISEDIYTHHHLQACYRDLIPTWNAPISNIVSVVIDPGLELLHDIHIAQFLRLPGILKKAINPAHIFGQHMLELHTRILVYLYADEPRKISDRNADSPTGFFHWYTINMAEASEDFLEQFFALFHSFITTATTITDESQLLHTFHAHADLDEFISLASFLTWHTVITSNDTSHTPLDETKEPHRCLSILLSTLDIMDKTLSDHILPTNLSTSILIETSPRKTSRPDFLFMCTALYLKRLWQTRPGHSRIGSLPDISLFSQLLGRLDNLQHNILIPYDEGFDRSRLPDVYQRMLNPSFSPSALAKKGVGNFIRYGHSCGLFFVNDPEMAMHGSDAPSHRKQWRRRMFERRRAAADEEEDDISSPKIIIPFGSSIPQPGGSSSTSKATPFLKSAIEATSPSPSYQTHYNPSAPNTI